MSGNILVVDDSGFIRFQYRNILESVGYNVYEAAEGRQVMYQTFEKNISLQDIDLILLDVYLPDYDGSHVLKYLSQKHPNIAVIVISIIKQKEKIIELIDMGANDYLVKPVDKSLLLPRVKKYVSAPAKPVNKEAAVKESHLGFDEDEVKTLLIEEIDRAVRADYSLVLMYMTGDMDLLKRLYQIAVNRLRRIDTVLFVNDKLILILPVTGAEGSEVVKEKLFSDDMAYSGDDSGELDVKLEKIIFPRDISKELIEQYKINEIFNELINKLESRGE